MKMRNKKVSITASVIIASVFLSAATPVLASYGDRWEQMQRDQVQKDILYELKKRNGNYNYNFGSGRGSHYEKHAKIASLNSWKRHNEICNSISKRNSEIKRLRILNSQDVLKNPLSLSRQERLNNPVRLKRNGKMRRLRILNYRDKKKIGKCGTKSDRETFIKKLKKRFK